MTAKKKPTLGDLLEETPTLTELDIDDFLEEWAPQTAIVEIYRRKEDGSMPHLKRVGMDILRADLYGYLRDKFGNGKFILQFKDANRRIVKNLTIDVEGAQTIVPNGNGSGTFLEQMVLTLIAANRPAPPPPPIDMGALMQGIGAMIGALKPATTDPAAMLQAMAVTFQQLKPPAEGGVKQALDLISAAKDLVPGGERSDDSWPGLLKDVGRTVVEVLRPKPNGEAPALPAIPPGAISTGTSFVPPHQPLPAAPPPEESPDMLLKKWLQAQLAFLKVKAQSGKDPEFWAEYILENQEEPGNAAIMEALRRGATFPDLLTFEPEIGKNPVLANWFQKLYEELHAALNEDLDSGGPGGDTPNPGGDAKLS